MSQVKDKQLKNIALRSFLNENKAETWLNANASSTNEPNGVVFRGLRYTNQTTGQQFEAIYMDSLAKWTWIPVEMGGSNIFLTNSSSPEAGKLGDPVDATKKTNLLPGTYPDVFTEIKVDDGESVNIEFDWDGGRDFYGEFYIYLYNSSNELLDVLEVSNGSAADSTNYGAVTASISAVSASDRRFRYSDVAFATDDARVPGTGDVEYFRIVGNGGVSDAISIVRAAAVAPVTSASFTQIESRGATTGLTTTDHTHVRSGQTYQVTFTVDFSSLTGPTNDNIPKGATGSDVVFELSGESVQGTYQVTYSQLQTWNPTYDTDASNAVSGSGTGSDGVNSYDFVIQGIPTNGSASSDNDLGLTIKSINAEAVEATSVAYGQDSAGYGSGSVANGTSGFDFDFDAGDSGNGFASTIGVPIDNVVIDVSGFSFTYPFYTQAGYTTERQLAIKTADTTRAVADRASFDFSINQALSSTTDEISFTTGGGITDLDDSTDASIPANALGSADFDGISGALSANVSAITASTVTGATGAGSASISVTAKKAKNDSQDSGSINNIRIIDVEPTISSSSPNLFNDSGNQTITFDQQMKFAETTAAVGTPVVIAAATLGGIDESTTGTVALTVDNNTVREVYDGTDGYTIDGFNVAGLEITTPIAETVEVRGFTKLFYDPKGATVGSGADFDLVQISGNDWYIQLPGAVEVSSASFGSNAGPSTGSPSSLSIGNMTIETSFAVSAVVTNYSGNPDQIKFTADGSLQTAINNASAPPSTGLAVEETI